jgi:hypothetical protein
MFFLPDLHPDSYTTPQVNFEGTDAEPPNTEENSINPLLPSHRDAERNFHTAEMIRDLGYTYPDD